MTWKISWHMAWGVTQGANPGNDPGHHDQTEDANDSGDGTSDRVGMEQWEWDREGLMTVKLEWGQVGLIMEGSGIGMG